ncbi:MAG: SDR family oxidoreductase [Opitutales bacterium]|nr:SDR family oxidoreductase [Opitutales bacterium]
MQIICTGATGLVGYNFIKAALARGHKIVAISGAADFPKMQGVEAVKLDLSDFAAVERFFLDRFPDAIANCAAISSPSVVDKDPNAAHKLNVLLPEKLAMLANHMGSRLVHLSTDMVFDGTAAPYKNTDTPCPFNLYGQTKLMAEKAVLKYAAPTSVVLRISHVCGRGLKQNRSFDEKLFLALARGEKYELPDNEIKCFVPASRIGEIMTELFERPNISGIYHYCGLESISRYQAGRRICEKFGLDADKFLKIKNYPQDVDFSLDMSCISSRVKTPAATFSEILDEIQIPDSCLEWYKQTTGKTPIKRFKL